MDPKQQQEPPNPIQDYFQHPANYPAVAEAVLTATGDDNAVYPPSAFSMLPGAGPDAFHPGVRRRPAPRRRTPFHQEVPRHLQPRLHRAHHPPYYPKVYSRKSDRVLHCRDLALQILDHLTKFPPEE